MRVREYGMMLRHMESKTERYDVETTKTRHMKTGADTRSKNNCDVESNKCFEMILGQA